VLTRLVTGLLLVTLVASCAGPGSPTATPDEHSGTASPTPSASPLLTPSASPEPTSTLTPTPRPTAEPTVEPTVAPTVTPGPTPATAFISVTVQPGDTLGSIARRHGTTWQSLVYWNRERYDSLDPANAAYDPNRIEGGWQLLLIPGVVVSFDAPLPTASPMAPKPASPQPTAAPVTASTLVTNGPRSSRMIALTFDMGGRTDPAVAIMTWLRDHNVPATIFMTGASADTTQAAREVLGIINARPALFDLGNHSYGHPDMTKLSVTAIIDELQRAEAAINRLAVQSPRPLFRPPFGAWNNNVLAGAGAAGYRWTVMWDVDTIDWKPIADGGPSAAQMVAKVLDRAQGGSIVLMHLGGYETLKALPDMVAGLRARGYTLVTLETMLGG
jgi:peptidoglycan/xylan/chitin deacetylase (PgdA/CDA1 family)